jgi:hypothetical protein
MEGNDFKTRLTAGYVQGIGQLLAVGTFWLLVLLWLGYTANNQAKDDKTVSVTPGGTTKCSTSLG